MSNSRKVGGEYGEIRATIDITRLNQYLERHVPAVSQPVDVKQFKVWNGICDSSCVNVTHHSIVVWSGEVAAMNAFPTH